MVKKVCCKCYRTIKEKEKYVLLGTYEDLKKDKTKVIEEKYFHIDCFRKFMQEKIDDKIEAVRKNLMQSAGVLAGNLMRNVRIIQ